MASCQPFSFPCRSSSSVKIGRTCHTSHLQRANCSTTPSRLATPATAIHPLFIIRSIGRLDSADDSLARGRFDTASAGSEDFIRRLAHRPAALSHPTNTVRRPAPSRPSRCSGGRVAAPNRAPPLCHHKLPAVAERIGAAQALGQLYGWGWPGMLGEIQHPRPGPVQLLGGHVCTGRQFSSDGGGCGAAVVTRLSVCARRARGRAGGLGYPSRDFRSPPSDPLFTNSERLWSGPLPNGRGRPCGDAGLAPLRNHSPRPVSSLGCATRDCGAGAFSIQQFGTRVEPRPSLGVSSLTGRAFTGAASFICV